jgi:hypothetical protein
MRTSSLSGLAGIALALLATPALADQACTDAWTKTIQPVVNR